MEFSRQEYWSGLPFPSPGNLPNLGIKPRSPSLQSDSLPSEQAGKPYSSSLVNQLITYFHPQALSTLISLPESCQRHFPQHDSGHATSLLKKLQWLPFFFFFFLPNHMWAHGKVIRALRSMSPRKDSLKRQNGIQENLNYVLDIKQLYPSISSFIKLG